MTGAISLGNKADIKKKKKAQRSEGDVINQTWFSIIGVLCFFHEGF